MKAVGCTVALAVALAGCVDAEPTRPREGETRDGALPAEDAEVRAPDAAPDPDAWQTGPPDAGPGAEDAGLGDAAPSGPDVAVPPPQIFSVETLIGAPSTQAGLANRVTCEALDADGAAVAGVQSRFEVRPETGWRYAEGDADSLVGAVAGTYHVTCTLPGSGLRDATPARWDVVPGPAAVVRAAVAPRVITAGGRAKVACRAFDAEGNSLDARGAVVEVAPANAGVEVDGDDVVVTTAGRYRVDCRLPGAQSEGDTELLVRPGLPAQLVAAVEPDRAVHEVGAVVGFLPRVTDAYGNVVEAVPLVWEAAPALPPFGEGRYRPAQEGRYHLVVRVDGPTFEDRELRAEADILVDAGGPAIACDAPGEGAMIGRGRTNFTGRVTDVAGLASVTVDGRQVAVDGQGRFTVPVDPAWGLNVHQITARDAVGNSNSTFCSYFAADSYAPEDQPVNDSILLHLAQAAVDDGPPDRPLRSLTDLLRRVVDSPGLVQTLDQTLRAQNPIVPNECRQRVFGICVFSAGAEYRGMRIRGPNTMSSQLTHGGLRVVARISGIDLDVRMLGTIGNTGRITASYIEVDLTFAISLRNGRPDVRLQNTNAVRIGNLSSDFDGFLTGAILDLIFSAFESTIRNELAGALRGFIEDQVDAILSDVLSGLDLASLGLAFEVPPLAGGAPTPLSLSVAFSTLDATPARLRVGISSRVNGPTRQGARSAGVPQPPGPVRIELQPAGNVGAAVHLGVLNQALHRLWRAGLFHLDNAGALLGDLPAGASVGFRVLVPPAVIGTGNGARLRLFLGPAVGELMYPGLFEEPLTIRLAAIASTQVALHGDELAFDGIQVDTLHVTVEGQAMSAQARATLERDLRRILQAVIDVSLNNALPRLPVPDFALPDSLAQFGIPRGTRLGLRNAALRGTVSHFLIDGTFRE